MNWYFYKIWLPLQALTLVGLAGLATGHLTLNLPLVLGIFFLIGPVGIGVGFHRLFSHRSFQTWKPVEYTLAILGTLSAYAPLLFWCAVHQQHHRVSDDVSDPSSPRHHGFWESYLWYRLRKSILKQVHLKNPCAKIIMRDKFLMAISKHFVLIVWTTIVVLALIDLSLLLNLFLLPTFLERQRTNIVSSFSHLSIPFSYRNYDVKDNSQNNLVLGYLTFGFSWHNNHHARPGSKYLRHRWWELDIEGLIAKALTK